MSASLNWFRYHWFPKLGSFGTIGPDWETGWTPMGSIDATVGSRDTVRIAVSRSIAARSMRTTQ